MSSNGQSGAGFGALCSYCGEAMGVYEPLIAVSGDNSTVRTSRLKDREDPADGLLVHEECFAKRRPLRGEGSS